MVRTADAIVAPLATDLKPGVCDAPLRGCGALMSVSSGESGLWCRQGRLVPFGCRTGSGQAGAAAVRSIALQMISSLRITAVSATSLALPLASSLL